ncbi:ShlB/FhaC/HecB family hemolysin secretion/activation protein [Thalassomonas viridans]|uniref:ShlB/FhaC/HecB family hemolysin secretion/activation protein n=1 Tax=Thalassomonas viridans TaxID=137584 RepID=A0AAF0CAE4_9GAMM|nr:ShlB/FhaC/HecB family hemolysin secretion/activation protein [Thalassomonas viridans]WDE08487.1 ShlB/FhaC/HecB family hemolysin secretion/activation protein [Thalassomonas viridans]
MRLNQKLVSLCISLRLFVLLPGLVCVGGLYAQEQKLSDHEKQIKQGQDRIKNQLDPLLKKQDVFLQEQYRAQEQALLSDDDGACFDIKQVIVENVTVFSEGEINNISSSFEHQCLGLNRINRLVTQISNLYLNHGYVTSRAYIQPQDLSDGTLNVLVLEGFIQALATQDEQLTTTQLALAFPGRTGKLLNLRDLEQGLENLNRLGQNQAKTALLPGDTQGSSVVRIDNQGAGNWRASVGINNTGVEATGEYQLDASFIYENLLGINDSWVSSFSSNVGKHELPQSKSRSYSLVASAPYGYWLFSLNNNYYQYEQTVLGASVDFLTHGSSFNSSLLVQNTLYRGSADKLNLGLSFNRKESRNYIEDVFLDTSSRTIYVWDLSADYTRYFSAGTLNSALHINKSVPWFDAKRELADAEDDFQFIKYQLELGFSTAFTLGEQPVQFSSNLNWFYSPKVILASEGLSVGGRYSVRGISGGSLFGYRGGYLRNDFYLPLETGLAFLPGLTMFFGLDAGTTNLPEYEDRNSDWVAGSVIGAQARIFGLNLSLSYARALRVPDFLDVQEQELDLTVRYNF